MWIQACILMEDRCKRIFIFFGSSFFETDKMIMHPLRRGERGLHPGSNSPLMCWWVIGFLSDWMCVCICLACICVEFVVLSKLKSAYSPANTNAHYLICYLILFMMTWCWTVFYREVFLSLFPPINGLDKIIGTHVWITLKQHPYLLPPKLL